MRAGHHAVRLSGDPTRRHQAVPVWRIGQGAGPGMQHTQDPDQPADVMWVCSECDERLGGGAEQDSIHDCWLRRTSSPQLLGQGQDDMKVGDR